MTSFEDLMDNIAEARNHEDAKQAWLDFIDEICNHFDNKEKTNEIYSKYENL